MHHSFILLMTGAVTHLSLRLTAEAVLKLCHGCASPRELIICTRLYLIIRFLYLDTYKLEKRKHCVNITNKYIEQRLNYFKQGPHTSTGPPPNPSYGPGSSDRSDNCPKHLSHGHRYRHNYITSVTLVCGSMTAGERER